MFFMTLVTFACSRVFCLSFCTENFRHKRGLIKSFLLCYVYLGFKENRAEIESEEKGKEEEVADLIYNIQRKNGSKDMKVM